MYFFCKVNILKLTIAKVLIINVNKVISVDNQRVSGGEYIKIDNN